MTRFPGAQRRIALLACSFLGACAIDDRVGRVAEMSPDDPEAPAASSGEGGEASGSPGMVNEGQPAIGNRETETGVAPVLPPPAGAGGSSSETSGPGSAQAGSSGSPEPGAPSTPTPGAPPPPPVTEPEVIGGCFNQLLRNGDFERGQDGWSEVSTARDIIVWRDHPDLLPTGVAPQAGNYLAWIGGIPNGEFTIYPTRLEQVVEVPAETISLTFSGYLWARQSELGRMPSFDWAILEVADPAPESSYLWRVEYFEDRMVEGWTYFEQTTTDVARFAGKRVPVQTFNVPNGSGTLSVWFDSLRLEARCPR